MTMKANQIRHVAAVSALLFLIIYFMIQADQKYSPVSEIDPLEEYGLVLTAVLYFLRALALSSLPLSIANFLGIVFFNLYPDPPSLKGSPLLAPFICFRVVTKGNFPQLVKDNIKKNLEMCTKVGLDNYMFEVVTDQAINLPKMSGTREIVVPDTYRTSKGSLFKARALQFCLEDGVNMLNDDNWIVHLDEETLLTEYSVIGIFNFVTEGSHHFGQGIITYASGTVVNWVTTLIDSVRVSIDYGALRLTFKFLHKPIFNWKGSFIVANVEAERKVSYDHGPEASIAEDCYFGILANSMGYSFGFVEGEMHEQSTFTFVDFLRQRRRWTQGICLACKSCPVPFQYKAGIFCLVVAMLSMPICVFGIPISAIYPVPLSRPLNLVYGFLGGIFVFLFVFGSAKSLSIRRLGIVKVTLLCISTALLIPVALLLEVMAVLWAVSSNKLNFHVVRKEQLAYNKLYSEPNTVLIA